MFPAKGSACHVAAQRDWPLTAVVEDDQANLNKLGHKIGSRGRRTHAALLSATRGLLDERPLSDIRPADVSAAAGISAPSFYTYFRGVDEVVLQLCAEAAEPYQSMPRHFDPDWSGDRAYGHARAYVLDVIAAWRTHGPVLRVETLMADEGHTEFAKARIGRLRRVHLAIERKIARARATGRHDPRLDPRLASYEAASMVDAVGAGLSLLQRGDTPLDSVIDTTALILVRIANG